jgi:hypothetical protein
MAAYFRVTVEKLLTMTDDEVVGQLAINQVGIRQEQLNAWREQASVMKAVGAILIEENASADEWSLLFEYEMLRIQRRIDLVLIADTVIFCIEFKMGASRYDAADKRQTEDYAFDLRDFHAASKHVPIVPILCASAAPSIPKPQLNLASHVKELILCNNQNLAAHLLAAWQAIHKPHVAKLSASAWDNASYSPVPTIIETAEKLYGANDVREIHEALADHINLTATTDRLIELIAEAHSQNKHRIIFVTGVPGSGKTLTGLNAVHDPRFRENGRGAGAFLSGNTPLVAVLREALAVDEAKRTEKKVGEARKDMRATIQNLMHFLAQYLNEETDNAPHDHVVVFDEAQRAWDAAYGKAKFDREASEPELFLSIMTRHQDWSVIVALVGGGQEINKGEGGLKLWGEALQSINHNQIAVNWEVYASPHVMGGSSVTAGSTLFDELPTNVQLYEEDTLHLPVSIRSHRCEVANDWIEAVLAGNLFEARTKANSLDDFRIYMTRSLDEMKNWLTSNTRGHRRCGLLASSDAKRLRAYGLGVNVGAIDLDGVKHWFLKPRGDVRSSYSMEITANEYACQGLELDNVGLCWGGDYAWQEGTGWKFRTFSGTKWNNVGNPEKKDNIKNTYRVLMSRARDSLVIWIPPGDADDPTRTPAVMDQTASFLKKCGVGALPKLEVLADKAGSADI